MPSLGPEEILTRTVQYTYCIIVFNLFINLLLLELLVIGLTCICIQQRRREYSCEYSSFVKSESSLTNAPTVLYCSLGVNLPLQEAEKIWQRLKAVSNPIPIAVGNEDPI